MTLTEKEKADLQRVEAMVLEHLRREGPDSERWQLMESLAVTIRRLTKEPAKVEEKAPLPCVTCAKTGECGDAWTARAPGCTNYIKETGVCTPVWGSCTLPSGHEGMHYNPDRSFGRKKGMQ